MPSKIIIVRHGETQYNVDRRLQGWTDIPLNDHGHEQAQKVAVRLSQESVITLYSSDHKRAHETALHIGKNLRLKPVKSPALREDRMGILEGWQWEKEIDPERQRIWESKNVARSTGNLSWNEDGGETLGEHIGRIQKFLNSLDTKYKNGTIIIVSHGGTINRMMEIFGFKKITDEYIHFKNTSVTIISKLKGKYSLELLNDISHL